MSEDKGHTNSPPKLHAAKGMLAYVTGPATALAVLLVLPGSAMAVIIVCGILAVTGFLLNIIYGASRKSFAIGTCLVLAVAAASGGAVVVKSLPDPHTPHVSGRKTAPRLKILLAKDQVVPWCNGTLNGTGNIPAGYALLLFDRETNANDQPSQGSEYSEVGQAEPLGGNWLLHDAKIGAQQRFSSFYVELTGVLVNKAIAAFVLAINSPAGWATLTLPPALESIHAFVRRDNDIAKC